MNRDEFMRELEYLLQDIQEEEKEEALSYYRDYLEEAGEDEEQAIREFGSPERIAAIIRSDIAGHLEQGGEFTERGYEDERFRDPNYQVVKRYDLPEQGEQPGAGTKERTREPGRRTRESNPVLRVVLGILLVVIGIPMVLGVGSGVIGLASGILGLLVTCIFTIAILTFAFFAGGIMAGVIGVACLAVSPVNSVVAFGVAFLMMGLGFLSLVAAVQFYGRFLPWLFRGAVNLISGLFHRKGR